MLAEANRTTPSTTTMTAKASSPASTSSTGQATGKYCMLEEFMGGEVTAKLQGPLERAVVAASATRARLPPLRPRGEACQDLDERARSRARAPRLGREALGRRGRGALRLRRRLRSGSGSACRARRGDAQQLHVEFQQRIRRDGR